MCPFSPRQGSTLLVEYEQIEMCMYVMVVYINPTDLGWGRYP